MSRVTIEYQDQFGKWKRYQTTYHEANAFRTATNRASNTGKRHRLVDEDGRVLDIIDP